MNGITIQIERSLQEQMLEFNIDWSLVCNQAIETKLNHLNNKSGSNNVDSLIDIDVVYNSSEIEKFDIPVFPREVYQIFKRVWIDSFHSIYPEDKPPTSQQIKQLWKSWYSPSFDEIEWWENWDDNKREEIEKHVSNAYSRQNQYTDIEAQKEFLIDFDGEGLNCELDPIYTAFIEFVSKFIFRGKLIKIGDLTPFNFESVKIENKDDLPEAAGIYFVIDESKIYYIGMSTNIQKRWYSHHKQSQIDTLSNIKIAYLDCLPKHYLKNIESVLINHFKPSLNIIENPLCKNL